VWALGKVWVGRLVRCSVLLLGASRFGSLAASFPESVGGVLVQEFFQRFTAERSHRAGGVGAVCDFVLFRFHALREGEIDEIVDVFFVGGILDLCVRVTLSQNFIGDSFSKGASIVNCGLEAAFGGI